LIRVLKVAIITPARNMQAISIEKAAAKNTAIQIMISSLIFIGKRISK